MEKIRLLIIIIFLFANSYAFGQIVKNSEGYFGAGFGVKNSYGSWGGVYGRVINHSRFEFKLGIGVRQNFCFASGINFRLFDNKKNLEFQFSSDFSYNLRGSITYNYNSSSQLIDKYNFSELYYSTNCISARWYFVNIETSKSAALQVKTGYSLLINNPSFNHTTGPNSHQAEMQKYVKSGASVAVEFLLFLTPKDFKFKKQKLE